MLDAPILILLDPQEDAAKPQATHASLRLVTLASRLTTGPIDAVWLGSDNDAQSLQISALQRIWTPDLGGLNPRTSAVAADAVEACLGADTYRLVLIDSTYRGRQISSRLATRLRCGAVVDASSVHIAEGNIYATKTVLAGTWSTTLQVSSPTAIIAVRSGATADLELAPGTAPAQVTPIPVSFTPEARAVEVISSRKRDTDASVSLNEAPVVVVGGRGTEGDFSPVEELAQLLGGAVGATRVATDEGWVPRSCQIGQTGVSVSPQLYVGLGVSGAIHHTVGMQASNHIVAVCDDPDAPIFELADFGVVGDLFEVVPQAIEYIKQARLQQ